ncbi:hypothetical protein [Rhizobium leguminosarum]|uniref:hypothetical protein n=1 Tax=Rhizobium leguminosarum TaxID=384 RepID=UPI001FD9D4B6|nr:hypothetical protein [Rhizobium leguminosarum]
MFQFVGMEWLSLRGNAGSFQSLYDLFQETVELPRRRKLCHHASIPDQHTIAAYFDVIMINLLLSGDNVIGITAENRLQMLRQQAGRLLAAGHELAVDDADVAVEQSVGQRRASYPWDIFRLSAVIDHHVAYGGIILQRVDRHVLAVA